MVNFNQKAKQENVFYFSDGKSISTINELIKSLKSMPEEKFKNHVNSNKNDFASWVEGVFNEKELAKKMKTCKNTVEMVDTIIEFNKPKQSPQELKPKLLPVKKSLQIESKKPIKKKLVKRIKKKKKTTKKKVKTKNQESQTQNTQQSKTIHITKNPALKNLSPKEKEEMEVLEHSIHFGLLEFLIGFVLGFIVAILIFAFSNW